jgi:hypothetical protein
MGILHVIGQKNSKTCPEPDTNNGLLIGTPAQVSVCISGWFSEFHPQRIKACNKVVTRDGTRCLHRVQFSIFLMDFEMRDENGKKGKIVSALFVTCRFFSSSPVCKNTRHGVKFGRKVVPGIRKDYVYNSMALSTQVVRNVAKCLQLNLDTFHWHPKCAIILCLWRLSFKRSTTIRSGPHKNIICLYQK